MQRDDEALERLAQRIACVPRILAYRNAKMGRPLDDDELQDAAQETFVVLLRRLPDYQPIAPLESWLYGICDLQLRDAVRNKLRRRQRAAPLADYDAPSSEQAPERGVLEGAEVQRLLQGLSGMEAKVLRLKHLEGRTFAEIATLLEISPNTAKTMHYRGLARLRRMLEAGGEETERP
jgi:RNA polymerase sigma-70 factor (ECF subfamily)